MHYLNAHGELPHYLLWWVNEARSNNGDSQGRRNASNAYFSVVHNILSIASVDYCLHIYNTIKTLFCQLLESLFGDIFNIFLRNDKVYKKGYKSGTLRRFLIKSIEFTIYHFIMQRRGVCTT